MPRSRSGPPTPLTFHILLALSDGPMHGYGVVKAIEERTAGELSPSTGSLYISLQRMEEDGWIAETKERPVAPEDDDARRKYYRITAAGREAARDEARRMAELVRLAGSKGLGASEVG